MANQIVVTILKDAQQFADVYNAGKEIPKSLVIQSEEEFDKVKTILSLIRQGSYVNQRKERSLELLRLIKQTSTAENMSQLLGVSLQYVRLLSVGITQDLNKVLPKPFLDLWKERQFDTIINRLEFVSNNSETISFDETLLAAHKISLARTKNTEVKPFKKPRADSKRLKNLDVDKAIEDLNEVVKAIEVVDKVLTSKKALTTYALNDYIKSSGYLTSEQRERLTNVLKGIGTSITSDLLVVDDDDIVIE